MLAYRPKEAAAALGLSRSQLYKLIQRGEINTCKSGSATLILRTEMERWLGQRMEDAGHGVRSDSARQQP